MKHKILLVEDDQNLGYIVEDQLKNSGFDVLWSKNGEKAKSDFHKYEPHICLLDVMLPGEDGFQIAEYIRSSNLEVPILFLTARDLQEDVLKGFKSGGDDYITKPFSMEELLQRINVFLRRSLKSNKFSDQNSYQCGTLKIDFSANQLINNGNTISLTEKEIKILKILINNKVRIVKREEILLKIWGDDDYFIGRSLDVFISKLRKYLKNSNAIINNFHGVGFKWEEKS